MHKYQVKYVRHENSELIGVQFFRSLEAAQMFVEKIKGLDHISRAEIIKCENTEP